jgi:hypothetical protein
VIWGFALVLVPLTSFSGTNLGHGLEEMGQEMAGLDGMWYFYNTIKAYIKQQLTRLLSTPVLTF